MNPAETERQMPIAADIGRNPALRFARPRDVVIPLSAS